MEHLGSDEHAALVRSAHAGLHRGDKVPPLVYADWLQEHGDPVHAVYRSRVEHGEPFGDPFAWEESEFFDAADERNPRRVYLYPTSRDDAVSATRPVYVRVYEQTGWGFHDVGATLTADEARQVADTATDEAMRSRLHHAIGRIETRASKSSTPARTEQYARRYARALAAA